MATSDASLSLRQALQQWCDPTLIAAVHTTRGSVERWILPSRWTTNFERDPFATAARRNNRERADELVARHKGAVDALLLDFQAKLERGEVQLRGVQTKPERQLQASPIHGAWAAEFEYEWDANIVKFAEYSYVAVRAYRGPLTGDVAPAAQPSVPAGIAFRIEDVTEFSDDQILALLEEHARRVVEGPTATLMPPGKVSLMPLIARKMQRRAAAGELLPRLAAETAWLADWIKRKAPSHHTPTASSIGNSLGKVYEGLKP